MGLYLLLGGVTLAIVAFGTWFLWRKARGQGLTEARVGDATLRAEAEQASHGGYAGEKERLEGLDPVTGRPDDGELRRPGDPGPGPA
jgi:hypothetical protein